MTKTIASNRIEAQLGARPRIHTPLFTKQRHRDTHWAKQPAFVFSIALLRFIDDADYCSNKATSSDGSSSLTRRLSSRSRLRGASGSLGSRRSLKSASFAIRSRCPDG